MPSNAPSAPQLRIIIRTIPGPINAWRAVAVGIASKTPAPAIHATYTRTHPYTFIVPRTVYSASVLRTFVFNNVAAGSFGTIIVDIASNGITGAGLFITELSWITIERIQAVTAVLLV
jgi:hypothetical protein